MAGENRCVGCGRVITQNKKTATRRDGALFHESCLEIFLNSDKGREWEDKYDRSKDGQWDRIFDFLHNIKEDGLPDNCEEYKKIEEDLSDSITDDDEDGYYDFLHKLNQYRSNKSDILNQYHLRVYREERDRLNNQWIAVSDEGKKVADECKDLDEEVKQSAIEKARLVYNEKYDGAYINVSKITDKLLLFNSDREEIVNFLSSVKNVRTDNNFDRLQKIAAKKFKDAKPSYNDLIIVGLLLIVNIIFLPIGIILLIFGIFKNINANKVAKYNYDLIKDIIRIEASTKVAIIENQLNQLMSKGVTNE